MDTAFPKLIAVVGYYESDTCPHCGAQGKHVFQFLCEDGVVRGAMRGCLKLFKPGPDARLVQEAFTRAKTGGPLASWWREMLDAATQVQVDKDATAFHARIQAAEQKRQWWLRKNGFKKKGS